ncbi:MAG: hypothetical protein AABX72_01635 [Nanoarchaeota archaeon]
MKHYALLIIFLLLSSVIALAQDTEDMMVKQEKTVETEEERLERMLGAFDRESIVKDRIVVSFTSTTSKEEAEQILETFNLHLATSQSCASTVDPGQEPVDQGCTTMEEWHDGLKIATAVVPEGTDLKDLALQLYNHDDIEWVEPAYTASLADEDVGIENGNRPPRSEQEPLGTLGDALQEELNVFERVWQWFKGLFN